MTLRKQIKYNAKRCLCNNWGKAVSIVLLSTAIYLLFVIIETIANFLFQVPVGTAHLIPGISDGWLLSFMLSFIMAVGSFLILVPLNLGIVSWYSSLSDGFSDDILTVFGCFANRRMFFRSLWLAFNVGIRILLSALFYLFLPCTGFALSVWILTSKNFSGSVFVGSLSLVLSAGIFLLALGFLLVRIQKYFLAKYYLLDGKTTVKKAIKSSIHATKGICDEIFLFKLSFIGWCIASFFILPLLYFSAYYSMSSLLYARFLIEDDRRANSLAVFPSESFSAAQTPKDDSLSQTKPFDCCSNVPPQTDEPTISAPFHDEND